MIPEQMGVLKTVWSFIRHGLVDLSQILVTKIGLRTTKARIRNEMDVLKNGSDLRIAKTLHYHLN